MQFGTALLLLASVTGQHGFPDDTQCQGISFVLCLKCMLEAHVLLPTQTEAPSLPQVASSFHALCDRGALAAPTPPPLQ